MQALQGILGPVVTTFSALGDLDTGAFAANLRAHLGAGMRGIVVTGSTGEAALLDERERGELVDAGRAVVPSDRLLIAGTGAESTRKCVLLTKDAAKRGADAVLVVAPHYYGTAMTASALSAHYSRIADESPVPVVLYNIPKYMHFALSPALVQELARHPNVVGIKDSSGDIDLLSAYLEAQSDEFSVLTGNGSTVHRALELGARGGILAVGLFATTLALRVWDAVRAGNSQAAAFAQSRLTPLSARIVGEMGIAGVKAALDAIGLHGGPLRQPLVPLSRADATVVRQLLSDAELSAAA
jgi:4-hydroxy-2-oxoglutarate aldolase